MRFFILCGILIFMNFYVFEKCEAKCDQYFLIIRESSCFIENLKPLKLRDIDWDEITYPCNSTDAEVIPFNKECFIEVDFLSTNIQCNPHVKATNYQNHSTILDETTPKPDRDKEIETSSTTTTTPKSLVIDTVKPNLAVEREEDKLMYNVKIIYINDKENNMNSTEFTTNFNTEHDKVYCDYAEIICGGEGIQENYKVIGSNETAGILNLTIIRDKSSYLQPIFTGYFFNDTETHPDLPFKDLKSMNITCNILKHNICKPEIGEKSDKNINIYLKTSYVQNNTITKYFNCTNNYTTHITNPSLNLKCNNTNFAKHNKLTIVRPQSNDTTSVKPDNITEQKIPNKKPNSTVNDAIRTSKYDVNLIYINENDITDNKNESKSRQHKLYCDFATLCTDEGNSTEETAESLQITINRDNTSPVQPIFTGYYKNHTKMQIDSLFKYFKSVNLDCGILIRYNCKQNIGDKSIKDINIYLKSNYVQNNTITRYPNCTKNSIYSTSNNSLNLHCDDVSFDRHNKHILNKTNEGNFVKKTDIKILTRVCQAAHSVNNDIYFENCSNNLNFNIDKNESSNKTHQTNNSSTTIDTVQNATTNISSAINKENFVKFLIPANANNCTKSMARNIHKGKIINSGISEVNKGKIIKTNVIELQLSNCTQINYIMNNTKPHPKKEVFIFVKEYPLYSTNPKNTKLFNESLKEAIENQNIILQCNIPNHNDSKHTAIDRTILKCQTIDLDVHTNTTDNKNTKEDKKVNLKQFPVINNETETSKSRNCIANETLDCNNKDKLINTQGNENKEDKKEVQNDTEGKADYSKGTFNRRTDIANGAVKRNPSQGNNELEKILLIGLSSIAGASMLVVLALKLRRKPREENTTPPRPPNEEETAFLDQHLNTTRL